MEVVGHKAVGVNTAPECAFPFFEVGEVGPEVVGRPKDGLAVMPALDDVVRPVG
jgi:hypothetical protein